MDDLLSEITEQNDQSPKYVNEALMNQTFQHVQTLYEKYGHDEFMTSKIYHYITQQLPTTLLTTYETRQKSQHQREQNEDIQRKFMHVFLNQGKYYYHPPNECFYSYDKTNYREITEDDVLYDILSTITRTENPILQNWKHKTKISTMKRVKECHLFKTIPESTTIQFVLNVLYPTIFREKNEAKYFLTILGDNLQRKCTDHIHFMPQCSKPFLKELNRLSYLLLSQNCTQTFKMKCHEKHYEMDKQLDMCRIVPIVECCVQTETLWRDTIVKYALDIFCVACHYSNRYKTSDNYLVQHSNNRDLVTSIYRMRENTLPILFEQFCKEYLCIRDIIETTTRPGNKEDHESLEALEALEALSDSNNPFWEFSPQESFMSGILQDNQSKANHGTNNTEYSYRLEITWKNMFYLWKDFLRVHKYPQNLYYINCKNQAIQLFRDRYNETTDIFTGIGSSQLPVVQKFLRFWDECIIEDDRDDYVLELDEICILFRKWLSQPHVSVQKREKYILNESKVIDILNYYKATVDIEDNKFVYRFRCVLWDKEMDIDTSVQMMKRNYKNTTSTDTFDTITGDYDYEGISIFDAYIFYSNWKAKQESHPLVASKLFFEQYVKNNYAKWIVDGMFTDTFLYQ